MISWTKFKEYFLINILQKNMSFLTEFTDLSKNDKERDGGSDFYNLCYWLVFPLLLC